MTPYKDLESQIIVVKNFFAEFFNKALLQDGRGMGSVFSASQLKALIAFREDKEYSMSELSRNAQVKSSTITDMIDSLEKEGIAERIRDARDRRVVKVRLTPKGKKLRRDFSERRLKETKAIFSKLSDEDREALIHHLDGACKILEKVTL